MNYRETLDLANNIIENEFNHIQAENLDYMDKLEEYNKIADEVQQIQDKLFKLLPMEYKDLVDDLDSKVWEMVCIEIRHYFKKGVVAGTANLNFLRDITKGTRFY